MSAAKLAALELVLMFAAGCGTGAPEPEPEADAAPEPPQFAVTGEHPCDPVGDVQFICDMVSPRGHRGRSRRGVGHRLRGAREGGRINLVSVGDKSTTVLFPTPDSGDASRRRGVSRLPRSARLRRPRVRVPRALPRAGRGRRPHPARRAPRPPRVDRRLGRGEADPPVARRRAGAEGRRRTRGSGPTTCARPSTARSSTRPATPTGTATRSPTHPCIAQVLPRITVPPENLRGSSTSTASRSTVENAVPSSSAVLEVGQGHRASWSRQVSYSACRSSSLRV